jgi:hypothetical protein
VQRRTETTYSQISQRKQDQMRQSDTETSGSGVREFLEGVYTGVDLGDDDGVALEQHRRHDLLVVRFRGFQISGGGAEASRPLQRPEETARRRRGSGQHGAGVGLGSPPQNGEGGESCQGMNNLA